jgi:RNA polymerase sigma factor (TIGR02999 family)
MPPAELDHLTSLVYRELHKMAKHHMEQQPADHTLQTTAVIHEAYLKLAAGSDHRWENRDHFLVIASKAMRHVLVDYARSRRARKRGGAVQMVQLDEELAVARDRAPELLALDDALDAMVKLYPRHGQVVELRYFGGLTLEETARILKISPETVLRDLRFVKAWLRRELGHASGGPPASA